DQHPRTTPPPGPTGEKLKTGATRTALFAPGSISDPGGVGAECGWWFELGSSIRGVEAYLPGCVVDDAVVMSAEQGEVVEGGLSTDCPMHDVVGVAHQGWSSAGGEGAVSVAEDQGGPGRGGDRSGGGRPGRARSWRSPVGGGGPRRGPRRGRRGRRG